MRLVVGIDGSNLRDGGGITHLRELLKHGEPGRADVERVIVWCGDQTASKLPSRSWLAVQRVPALDHSAGTRAMFQFKQFSKVAADAGCNVLFAPGGLIATHPNGLPTVTMCRTLLPFEPGEAARQPWGVGRMRLSLLARLQARSMMRASGVIFLSQYAQSLLSSLGITPSRSIVIPHGVDQSFRASARQVETTSWTAAKPFRVVYVSTVDLYKHQWHVVSAIAALRASGIAAELVMAGPVVGGARERFFASLDQHDPERTFLKYVGRVDAVNLPALLHSADAFAYASSCENLPNSLIEAMASALPIASSNRGPMPEVLGTAALFFNPENPDEISTCLRTLATDAGVRNRLSLEAAQRSMAYDWRLTAARTFDFIRLTVLNHRS